MLKVKAALLVFQEVSKQLNEGQIRTAIRHLNRLKEDTRYAESARECLKLGLIELKQRLLHSNQRIKIALDLLRQFRPERKDFEETFLLKVAQGPIRGRTLAFDLYGTSIQGFSTKGGMSFQEYFEMNK